jgi:hypothetical protein
LLIAQIAFQQPFAGSGPEMFDPTTSAGQEPGVARGFVK